MASSSSTSSPPSSSASNNNVNHTRLITVAIAVAAFLAFLFCSSSSSSSFPRVSSSSSSPEIVASSLSTTSEMDKIVKEEKLLARHQAGDLPEKSGSNDDDDTSLNDDDEKILYPDFYNKIRTKNEEKKSLLLQPLENSCNLPYGGTQCPTTSSSKKSPSSSPCCCCCWKPLKRTCAGNFRNTKTEILTNQIAKTGFVKAGLQTRSACPWFDFGEWNKPLPENFVSLSPAEFRKMNSAGGEQSICPCQNQGEDGFLYGLAFLHKLARENKDGIFIISGDSITRQLFSRMIHRIRSRECSSEAEMRRSAVFEIQTQTTVAYVASTSGDGYVLASAFDQCQEGVEFLEKKLRSSSSKIVFRSCLVWDNTFDGSAIINTINRIYWHASVMTHHFVARSRNDRNNNNFINTSTTTSSSSVTNKRRRFKISSLMFSPQIWFCAGYYVKRHLCLTADRSNGIVMTVMGVATRFSIPRVTICTSLTRQSFSFFQVGRVKQRNRRLLELFPHAFIDDETKQRRPWIRTISSKINTDPSNNNNKKKVFDESNEKDWNYKEYDGQAAADEKSTRTSRKEITDREFKENSNIFTENNHDDKDQQKHNQQPQSSSWWTTRIRLYDLASRHASLRPQQCDSIHGMCIFLPARKPVPFVLMNKNDGNNADIDAPIMIGNTSFVSTGGGGAVASSIREISGGMFKCPFNSLSKRSTCQDMGNFVLLDDLLDVFRN